MTGGVAPGAPGAPECEGGAPEPEGGAPEPEGGAPEPEGGAPGAPEPEGGAPGAPEPEDGGSVSLLLDFGDSAAPVDGTDAQIARVWGGVRNG